MTACSRLLVVIVRSIAADTLPDSMGGWEHTWCWYADLARSGLWLVAEEGPGPVNVAALSCSSSS